MSLERIFKTLLELGLLENEAELYIHVATKGPNTVKNLANDMNINKRHEYQQTTDISYFKQTPKKRAHID